MMKRIFPLLVLAVLLLPAAGCRTQVFGPVAVPLEYEIIPVDEPKEKDLTRELTALQNLEPRPYVICPQDRFSLMVYEQPDFKVLELVITPDGYLSMPLVGPVKVGGLTLVEATEKLKQELEVYIKKPRVALIPFHMNGFSFTIVGRVREPGRYPISIGQTRLVDAIAFGKGFDMGLFNGDSIEMADLENSYVSRDGKILPVSFVKALHMGDPLHNIPLQNGDYIYVPSVMSRNLVIVGEVRNPTFVGYKEGVTLLHSVAYAGGLLETYDKMVKVIRGGLRNPIVYNINIDRILGGQAMDFPLQAQDIVYIPRDAISEWNVLVRKVMPTLQALSMLAGPFGNPSGYVALSN